MIQLPRIEHRPYALDARRCEFERHDERQFAVDDRDNAGIAVDPYVRYSECRSRGRVVSRKLNVDADGDFVTLITESLQTRQQHAARGDNPLMRHTGITPDS